MKPESHAPFFRWVILTCLLWTSFWSTAQEYQFRRFTVEDGLPSSECHFVIQDSKGYIWVATDQGIARYDGQHFKVYSVEEGMQNSFTFRLYEDGQGRIWFITFDNTLQYIEGDTVKTWFAADKIRALIPEGARIGTYILEQDTLQLFLIGTESDIDYFKIDLVSGEVNPIKSKVAEHHCLLYALHPGVYDLGTFRASTSMQEEKKIELKVLGYSDQSYKFSQVKHGSYGNRRLSGITNSKGQLILHIFNRLIVLDQGEVVMDIEVPGKHRGTLFLENDSTIWEGRADTPPIRITFSTVKKDASWEEVNLPISAAIHFYRDREGGVWINSIKEGLMYIPEPAIRRLQVGNLEKEIYSGLGLTDNRWWAGTQSGYIHEFDRKSLKWLGTERVGPQIFSLIADQNQVYFSSEELFSSFNRPSFHHISAAMNIQPETGGIMGAGPNGYTLYKAHTRTEWQSWKHGRKLSRATALAKYSDTLFIGRVNGLFYENESLEWDSLSASGPTAAIRDMQVVNNVLWVATAGQGLYSYQKGNFYSYQVENSALASNFVNDLFAMGDTLWLATSNGVQQILVPSFGGELQSIWKFTTANGLASNEVTRVIQDGNRVLVTTKRGLCFIDLNALFESNYIPPVHLQEVKVNGKVFPLESGNLDLSYKQNNLTISFAGLTYKNGSQAKYKYRLLGADDRFLYSDLPQATLLGLSPGEYTFEVYALSDQGRESQKPARFSFEIHPVIWETWWFRISVALSILLFGAGFLRMRLNQQRKNGEMLLRLNQLRQKALNAQMNPHFIFNSLGSIQNLILDDKNDEAEFYLTRFSKLMRQTLNVSERLYSSLDNEIGILKEYIQLENLRFNQDVQLIEDIESGIQRGVEKVPTMLFQTLVENAIIHGIIPAGRPGEIKLIVRRISEDVLQVQLEDNGIGLIESQRRQEDQPKKHRSKGTLIVRARLEALSELGNRDFKISYTDLSEEGKQGTRVTLIIPVINNEEEVL